MSAFTAADVRHLAALARLDLDPEDIQTYARQLGEILEFARQVQAADTRGLADDENSSLSPLPPWRDDVREPSLPRDDVLAAAPDGDPSTGLFKVPRVLNG